MKLETNREEQNRLVPLLLLVGAMAVSLAGCFLFYLNRETAVPPSWGSAGGARNNVVFWFNTLQMGLLTPLLTGAFGNLILRRRAQIRIGQLFITISLISAFSIFISEYTIYGAYTQTTPLPGASLAAWVNNFIWIFLFAAGLYLLALFPNGRFLSPHWRTLILTMLLLYSLSLFIGSAIETPLSSAFQLANPFFSSYPAWLYNTLFTIGVPAMLLSVFAVLLTVLLRFRHSQGRERQQMKWLLSGVTLMAFAVSAGFLCTFVLHLTLGDIIVNTSFLWPLIGVGVALVRHQLYDIDIFIRRTLQYTLLTSLLGVIYFGSVLLLQALFSVVTGQESAVAIVISTLLIAALFTPLRHRIQSLIDRRFFRQKYDAQQVLAQFAQTARDKVAIGQLTTSLIDVVEKTLQPEQISLWLKPTFEE